MTTEQILREFDSLSRQEQESLAKAIEARLHGNGVNGTTHSRKSEEKIQERRAAAQRLHGILRGDGPALTDEEIEKMRDDYLMEKYG